MNVDNNLVKKDQMSGIYKIKFDDCEFIYIGQT